MKLWTGIALIVLGILSRIVGLDRISFFDFGCLHLDIACTVAGVIWIVRGLRVKKQ